RVRTDQYQRFAGFGVRDPHRLPGDLSWTVAQETLVRKLRPDLIDARLLQSVREEHGPRLLTRFGDALLAVGDVAHAAPQGESRRAVQVGKQTVLPRIPE